jgi:hypothetical protein
MQERYGTKRRPWLLIVFGAALIVGTSAALIAFLAQFINPPVRDKLLAFEVLSPNQARITWEVRRQSNQDVVCALRAQDLYRGDVAYALIPLPADGNDYLQTSFTLNTNDEAFTVEVLACAEEGELLPASGLQFPPGATAPAQPAPAIVPTVKNETLIAPMIETK